MNDLGDLPGELLEPVAHVADAVLASAQGLQADDVMLVGAVCRDLHHQALGHRFAATATHDLDLALALPSWDAFGALAAASLGLGTQEFGSALRRSSSTFFRLATSRIPKVRHSRRLVARH